MRKTQKQTNPAATKTPPISTMPAVPQTALTPKRDQTRKRRRRRVKTKQQMNSTPPILEPKTSSQNHVLLYALGVLGALIVLLWLHPTRTGETTGVVNSNTLQVMPTSSPIKNDNSNNSPPTINFSMTGR